MASRFVLFPCFLVQGHSPFRDISLPVLFQIFTQSATSPRGLPWSFYITSHHALHAPFPGPLYSPSSSIQIKSKGEGRGGVVHLHAVPPVARRGHQIPRLE